MTILEEPAEECEQKASPTANNDAASAESAFHENTLDRGGKSEKLLPVREWDTFSVKLAAELNPRQPDISAALLFKHVALRMAGAPWYVFKDHKMWYFRSIKDLREKEFPYLTEDEITGALDRLQVKGKLEIAPPGTYGPTCWYSASDKDCKKYGESGEANARHIWIRQDDAIAYGVRKAMLLANLGWQLKNWKSCETDDKGDRYGTLSPSYLSKRERDGISPLPMSRSQISNLLKELSGTDGVLTPHPLLSSRYKFTSKASAKVSCDGSKSTHHAVQDHDPLVQDHGLGVQDHDSPVQDHGGSGAENECKLPIHNDLCNEGKGVYSNQLCKKEGNETRKVNNSLPASASPSQGNCFGNELSEGAKKLMEAIHHCLCASGQKGTLGPAAKRVRPDQLPYDDVTSLKHECFYDTIIPRAIEIKNAVQWVKQYWRTFKVRYDKKDIDNFTRLFVANPFLTLKHWQDIEYYIGSVQLEHYWFDERSNNAPGRARTAAARLYLLPQIIQEGCVSISKPLDFVKWEHPLPECLEVLGTVPEPYASLDFSVLDEVAESALWRVVPPPLKFVEHDSNPITTE